MNSMLDYSAEFIKIPATCTKNKPSQGPIFSHADNCAFLTIKDTDGMIAYIR